MGKPRNCSGAFCRLYLLVVCDVYSNRKRRYAKMAVHSDENEAKVIDGLVVEAEILLETNESKKELKEKRGVIKQTLYDGSKRLKHTLPKGKHL
jgi:Trp operon repressor